MTPTQREAVLKPCPFCGGEARVYCTGDYWCVLCSKCEGEGPPSDHEGGAIAYWNRRSALEGGAEPVAAFAWMLRHKKTKRIRGWWEGAPPQDEAVHAEQSGCEIIVLYTHPGALEGGEEWITVADRLPEKREKPYQVLALCAKRHRDMCYAGEPIKGVYQDWVLRNWPQNYSHWREIPPLPATLTKGAPE